MLIDDEKKKIVNKFEQKKKDIEKDIKLIDREEKADKVNLMKGNLEELENIKENLRTLKREYEKLIYNYKYEIKDLEDRINHTIDHSLKESYDFFITNLDNPIPGYNFGNLKEEESLEVNLQKQ